MTTSALGTAVESDHDLAARMCLPVGALSLVVAVTLCVLGANDTAEWVVLGAAQVVVAALLFGLVVPQGLRHESAGGRALVMAVLGAVLVVPAFWSGLPVLLGVAAAMLGYAGKRAATGSGTAITALVLGVLTVVAYLAIYLSDFLANR